MRSVILFLLVLPLHLLAQAPQSYTTFQNATLNLYKYEGAKVMVLANSPTLNASAMTKLTNALDGTYDFYKRCTGREPTRFPNTFINNRTTVARVDATCGAGCGYLGATGIELLNSFFDVLYTEILNNNLYDQAVFYEFGRNFWFYGNLAYKQNDPVTTGFAVFMRFMAMEDIGVQGAKFGNMTFTEFRNKVQGLLPLYLANSSLNWSNTLGAGQGVPNSGLGGADLFASFCWYLKNTYGQCWLENVWKYAGERPDAVTTQDAVDNFIIASSLAAKTNLAPLFQQTWRWPVSTNAVNYLAGLNFSDFDSPSAPSCIPAGIQNPNNGFDIGIRQVILADMQYNSGGYSADNYQFYKDNTVKSATCPKLLPVARLQRGNTYNISVRTGISNPEFVRGWIDYNNNGVFETSTEIIIFSNGNVPNQLHTASFIVPSTAVTNTSLRMRLSSDFGVIPQPCTNLAYGQTEDFTVLISVLSSVNEFGQPDVSVFPNPVSNILQIQSQEKVKSVRVFDVNGQLKWESYKPVKQADLSFLAKGMYVVVVETGKQMYRKKILKE